MFRRLALTTPTARINIIYQRSTPKSGDWSIGYDAATQTVAVYRNNEWEGGGKAPDAAAAKKAGLQLIKDLQSHLI